MNRRRAVTATITTVAAFAALAWTSSLADAAGRSGEVDAADAWVVLVRHAEKLDGDDPDLTDAGRARAEALSHALSAWPVEGIYVTRYLRTQATAVPLADRLGIEAEVVDAGDVAGLAERIGMERRAAVVVVGHSNTVPALIRALGVADVPEIPESRYDDLFLVRMDEEGAASLIHMKYGAPSPG